MNGRRLVVLGCLMGLMPLGRAMAAALPAEVRTTTNPQSVRAPIQTFIDEQVGKLSSGDLAAQTAAREALVAEVQQATTASPKPTPEFLDPYAEVLNTALLPLAKNQDPRIRLNAAVIAARVAERANNARLMPVVVDLLDDECEGVVLWAIKASKFLIPPVLSNAVTAEGNPLVPAFVKTFAKYQKSGPIVQSAYESLKIADQGANAVPSAAWKTVVPLVVGTLQGLVEMRIADYKTGIPPLPPVEAIATSFLVDGKVWAEQPKAQRLRTVQIIADLMSVAAERWTDADVTKRQELTHVISKASEGAWVIGNALGSEKVKQAIVKIGPGMAAPEVAGKVAALRGALKALPEFAELKPPPSLAGATSAPASTHAE